MKIRRFIAALLAALMLSAFAGCSVKQDTGKETLGAADGKTDEAVSEQQDESPASDANDPASDSDGSTPAPDGSASAPGGNTVSPNGGSQSGSGKPAGQTQKPTSAPTAATAKPDVKKSKYFLGTDLDGWYHWNQIGEGFQGNTEYIAIWDKEYNSRGNIVKQSSYDRLGDEIRPYGQCFYEYSYNGDGTVKEIRRSGYFPATFRYEYDAAKRITKVTKSDPATGEVTDTLTLSYNKSGKLACAAGSDWKVLSSYDGSGRLTKKEKTYNGIVKAFTYEYNSRNDVVRKTETGKYPDSSYKIVYDYKYAENGALIKLVVLDPDGILYEREYTNDKYGNPTEIKEIKSQNGKVISSYVYPFTYEYAADRITVTSSDSGKKIYGYQKNESIITTEYNFF